MMSTRVLYPRYESVCGKRNEGEGFRVRWADADQADRAAGSPTDANGPLNKYETVVVDSKRNIIQNFMCAYVRMPRYSRELLRSTTSTTNEYAVTAE